MKPCVSAFIDLRFLFQSVMEWSSEKYEAVFNSFSDNLAGKSYRDRYYSFDLFSFLNLGSTEHHLKLGRYDKSAN